MNTLIFRYLAREIFFTTALVLVAFLGLFAFFDFINELDNVGKDGYALYHALVYVLMILPRRIYELLPIAVLIGSLLALTTLARHSEITVMRTSGLSTAQMLRALSVVGVVFALLTFLFGEYLAPPAENAAQQWRLTVTNSSVSGKLDSGLWVRDGSRIINVRTLMPDRNMENVRIYTFGDEQKLESISDADRGEYAGEGRWRLRGVTRTLFLEDRTELVRMNEDIWQSELTPEVLSVLMIVPERMSVANLWTYIRHLRDNQQSSTQYEIAMWKKLAYPFAALVMIALALPFALGHDRGGAVSVKLFAGIMLGVGFHLLNGLFSNLGMITAWPPLLAAFTPSLLFLAAAGAMLYMVERR